MALKTFASDQQKFFYFRQKNVRCQNQEKMIVNHSTKDIEEKKYFKKNFFLNNEKIS